MIRINDLNSPELSIFSKLSEVQLKTVNEPSLGLFVAESPKVIMRAIDAGYEPVAMLIDESENNEENVALIKVIEDYAACSGKTGALKPEIYAGPKEVLSGITGFNLTRGALCAFKRKKLMSLEKLCEGAKRIVVLEDVVNPTNLGAIFRSAAALGIDAVYITRNSTDPLYRRAARVSMGTVFQIPWTKSEIEEESITNLFRNQGFKTMSFALRNNSIDINNPVLKREDKLAIILGTEGDGLKSSTIDDSDFVVKIPMTHGVDSLNVAAASAVAFWELGNNK